MLVRSEDEAHFAEEGSIGHYLVSERPASLGQGIAWFGVRAFGPALLHANGGGNAVHIAGLVSLLLGLGAGWFAHTAVALGFAGIACLLLLASAMLSRVERHSLALPDAAWPRETASGWLLDAAIVAILAWSVPAGPWMGLPQRLFAPLMLIAVIRLLPRAMEAPWLAAVVDRFALTILLSAAALAGYQHHAVYVLALGLAMLGVLLPREPTKLTRA